MHSFYTYAHARKTDGRIFYIGKGQDDRAYSEKNRNRYWHNVVNKHGYDVQILCDWPTEEEAFDHEKMLISCFRDMGYELVNLTDGGEGPSGVQRSEETRARLSEAGKAYFADPGARARNSEAQKKAYARPQARMRLQEGRAKYWADPEARALKSAQTKAQMADPEVRAQLQEKRAKYWADPEARARQSEQVKARMADPEFQAQMQKRVVKAVSGSRWVNNGIESKRIKPEVPMPEGFVLGRLPRKKV